MKIKDILPNPYRDLRRYPISREKVDALRESIRDTGFWDNLIGRINANGKVEIAYGHHRMVAVLEELGPDKEIDITIRDLSNADMLRILGQENREEWSSTVVSDIETIRAVVLAYAADEIKLKKGVMVKSAAKGKNIVRFKYAPSFVKGNKAGGTKYPYTNNMVAKFLGWILSNGTPQPKVALFLSALEFTELGVLKEDFLEGLTTIQAYTVIAETRKSYVRQLKYTQVRRKKLADAKVAAQLIVEEKQRKRKERQVTVLERECVQLESTLNDRVSTVAESVGHALRVGDIRYKDAPMLAAQLEFEQGIVDAVLPDITKFSSVLATNISKLLRPESDTRVDKLREIIKYRKYLLSIHKKPLVIGLRELSKRAAKFADDLESVDTEQIHLNKRKLLEGKEG